MIRKLFIRRFEKINIFKVSNNREKIQNMGNHCSDLRAALKLYRQTFLSIDSWWLVVVPISTTLLLRQLPKNPCGLRIPLLNTPPVVFDDSMVKGNRTRMPDPFITQHVK